MVGLLSLLSVGWQDPQVMITVTNQRRIVMDAGAGGYQAFPDVCRLKNGDLLCVFYAGYGHVSHPNEKLLRGGRICAVRSKDEGATWGPPTIVVDTTVDDRDPSIMSLPDGTLLCTFFTYGLNTECDTQLVRSKDGGLTWSAVEMVAPGHATSTPARRLRSGRLLLPVYAVDGNGKRAYAGVCVSDDGGKRWSGVRPIGQDAKLTIDETDVYERKDGVVIAFSREVMVSSESHDKGWTWKPVVKIGFVGHCPALFMTKQGVLLMAHRIPQTSLHWSLDEGRTWAGPVQIDNFIGAYPSMVQLREGTVLCVYYEEGANSAIRSALIHIDRR